MVEDEVSGGQPSRPCLRDDAAPGPVQHLRSGRSAAEEHRIAIHEASHAVVRRALGMSIGGATIVPGADYGGMVWGPEGGPERLKYSESLLDTLELYAKAREVMPALGEPRNECATYYQVTWSSVIELVASTEGERLLCDGDPLDAVADRAQAWHLAEAFCCLDDSEIVETFIAYCRAEAGAIIRRHREAVLSVAAGLVEKRTLTGNEIDVLIFEALGRATIDREKGRRREWAATIVRASEFEKLGGCCSGLEHTRLRGKGT